MGTEGPCRQNCASFTEFLLGTTRSAAADLSRGIQRSRFEHSRRLGGAGSRVPSGQLPAHGWPATPGFFGAPNPV